MLARLLMVVTRELSHRYHGMTLDLQLRNACLSLRMICTMCTGLP